jgi:hypothetical protein
VKLSRDKNFKTLSIPFTIIFSIPLCFLRYIFRKFIFQRIVFLKSIYFSCALHFLSFRILCNLQSFYFHSQCTSSNLISRNSTIKMFISQFQSFKPNIVRRHLSHEFRSVDSDIHYICRGPRFKLRSSHLSTLRDKISSY